MDLNTRFNVLSQAVEIAQKKGVLSLDDAFNCKTLINKISNGEELKESFKGIIGLVEVAYAKGAFTLQDAHYLYLAVENIDAEIDNFMSNQTQETQSDGVEDTDNIPGELAPEEPTQTEEPVFEEVNEEKPKKKRTSKKK